MNDDRWYRLGVAWTGGLLVAGVLLAIGREVVPDVLAVTQERGHDRALVAAALLMGVAAGWLAVVRFLGPTAASAAQQRWQIDAQPFPWQRTAAVRLMAIGAVAAAAVGAVIGLASGSDAGRAVGVGATGAAVLLTMLWGAILLQRRDVGPHLVGWLSSVALGLLTVAAWGPVLGVLVGVVTAAGATRNAGPWRWRRGSVVPRWNLASAAARRSSAYTATLLMEAPAGPASTGERRAVPLLPATGVRRLAVIATWRAAGRVAVIAGLGLVVAAVTADLLGHLAGLVVVVVTLHLATTAATRVLLAWWTAEATRRPLALPHGPARVALSLPAVVSTAVTLVPAVAVLGLSVAEVVALLALPVLATWSRVSAATSAEQIAMMSTPMGSVPLQLVTKVVAGADATVIVLIALLVIDQVTS